MVWKTYLNLMHTEAFVMCIYMYVVEGNQRISLKYLWFDCISQTPLSRAISLFRCTSDERFPAACALVLKKKKEGIDYTKHI